MVVAVTLVVSVVCFLVSYLIADKLCEKHFWDRQNYMEKLNRKF